MDNTATKYFRIENTTTGHDFGIWRAASPEGALDQMYAQAGQRGDATELDVIELDPTGYTAIEIAREYPEAVILCSYSDPTSEGAEGLDAIAAEEIAAEDPGLLYLRPVLDLRTVQICRRLARLSFM